MAKCDGCESLRQSLKALREEVNKRLAEHGRQLKALRGEGEKPVTVVKPSYVSHFVQR
jgi:hypothetical protein